MLRQAQHDVLVLTLALTLALAACVGRNQPQPSPSDLFGPYTATGTIVGTGASLYRRGTHVLMSNSRPQFFLESREVNLQEFEGFLAVIRGEVTPNTHETFLPIFQVQEVTLLGEQPIGALEKYDVPALSLTLEAPEQWLSTYSAGRLSFRLTESSAPIVEIVQSQLGAVPEGLSIRIGGRNGVRVVDEQSGKHLLYVEPRENAVILFTFTPTGEDPMASRDAFYALIRSVRFLDADSSASSTSSTSSASSVPFIPCGGPAHVLCPAGMYCEVRELDTGIGACRPLE